MSDDYGWGGSDPFGGTPYLTDEDVARQQINADAYRYPSKFTETWPFRLGRAVFGALSVPGGSQQGNFGTMMPQEEADLPATPVDKVVGGAGHQIASGVTAAGDAVAGKITSDDQMFKRGWDLANTAAMASVPGIASAIGRGGDEAVFGSLGGVGHNGGPPLPQPGANPGGFYSAAQRAVETSPIKGAQTPEQWGAYLKNQPGVKADELESLGLLPGKINPALANESLNKDQLVAHIAPNTPKFDPIVRGEKPKLDETGLEKLHPEEFALLREHGIEPTIDEDQRFLGFWDGDDILHADDYRGDGVDAPRDVRDAVRRLASTFRDGDGSGAPTQYDDWTGIPGHADRSGGNNDPNYRETIYQIQRKGRDSTGPDEIAAEKYQKSWDDVNAQIRAQQERVNEARIANSTSYADELFKRQQLEKMRDQIHDRMVDDTYARKPYWQNRGMTADSDAIMQRAQEGHANQSLPATGEPNVPWDEKTQSYRSGIYDQARYALDPHGNAPYNFELPHFNGEEDGLYHLRHTEGQVGGFTPEKFDDVSKKLITAVHGGTETDPEFLEEMAQMRYENTVAPDRAGNVTYWKELPDADKAKWRAAAQQDVHDSLFGDLGSGAPGAAVQKGLISPEEAADFSRHMGWQSGFEEKPGLPSLKAHHLEEVQSDWLQRLRDKGYQIPPDQFPPIDEQAKALGYKIEDDPVNPGKVRISDESGRDMSGNTRAEAENFVRNEFKREAESGKIPDFKYNSNIPDAPFKTKWHELALKQAVLDAVKNGKDAVTWWPGSVHAERYGFDRHVQEIRYDPATQQLTALPKGGLRGWAGQVKPEDLPDHVGPELAAKLTAPLVKRPSTEFQAWREQNYQMLPPDATPQDAVHFLTDLAHDFPENQSILRLRNEAKQLLPAKYNSVSGDNLKFSDDRAKGMRGFYDTMLPRTANSLFKKYGVKVERDTVKTPRGTGEAHVLKITPKLRETVQHEGLPLFNAGVPLPTILNDGREDER